MRGENLARVLDRTEILLGARQDLGHVSHQPVGIFAIGAVNLLDPVEITEVVAVKYQVVAAPHPGDAIDRKAGPLVDADEGIEHDERNRHAVDERPGDQVLRPVDHQPAQKTFLQLQMRIPDRTLEFDAFALDLEKHPAFLLVDRAAQVILKRGNLLQYLVDSLIHGLSIRAPA